MANINLRNIDSTVFAAVEVNPTKSSFNMDMNELIGALNEAEAESKKIASTPTRDGRKKQRKAAEQAMGGFIEDFTAVFGVDLAAYLEQNGGDMINVVEFIAEIVKSMDEKVQAKLSYIKQFKKNDRSS